MVRDGLVMFGEKYGKQNLYFVGDFGYEGDVMNFCGDVRDVYYFCIILVLGFCGFYFCDYEF